MTHQHGIDRSSPRAAALLWLSILLIATLASSRIAAAQGEAVRVLLLYPTDLMLPAVLLQDRITREAIAAAHTGPIEFYSEAFDMYRLPGVEQQQQFVSFLKRKYADRALNLIVTHGPMQQMMKDHRDELWPRIPILFADVGAHRITDGELAPDATYTSSQIDTLGTARLALHLQPQTRAVLVVAGDSIYDRDRLTHALRELEPISSDVTISTLTGVSLEQMVARVSSLTSSTVVLYLTMQRDARGDTHVPRDVLEILSRASAVPTYAVNDTYIGHGIVGGSLMNREGQREAIGEIARRLLRGEPTTNLPMPVMSPGVCKVDWRELTRWKIDPQRVPDECNVMFREATFLQRYRVYIIVAAFALLLQGAWISAWWVQRERRRKAERAATLRTSELTHAARLGAVGGLMASITHEISQPLMSILTNAAAGERMIASGRADMEEIRSILADIRSDEARAGAVVTHLREFLKKREVAMEPVHLNELVNKVLKIIESAARKHEVKVMAELDENVALVSGDAVHLQQVMLNLAINAVEAMASHPATERVLTIRTVWRAKYNVEVSVNDTGCGIPADRLPHLFEAFYSSKAGGMGIGLSIAQMIVEAHGGRIWAEPTSAGTTMRFTIPLSSRHRSGPSPRAALQA
jgi:signal transduction histidine kinase